MPSVFFGHGNPMNAVQQNAFTDGWRRIAASIAKPRAILAISAHWYLPATAVTMARVPGRSMILADSQRSYSAWNIRHRAMNGWAAGFGAYCILTRWILMTV